MPISLAAKAAPAPALTIEVDAARPLGRLDPF
jgi:hypothetical protein